MQRARGVLLLFGLGTCAAGVYAALHLQGGLHGGLERAQTLAPGASVGLVEPALPQDEAGSPSGSAPDENEDDRAYSFRVPSGEPAALSCEAARAIVNQARSNLACDPEAVSPHALAVATADWLDPHGLWSAAPDAPIEAALVQHGAELVRALEGPVDANCAAAHEVGSQLAAWVAELGKRFDAERAATRASDLASAADGSMFEGTTPRPAKELASILGRRVGAVERGLGPAAAPYATAARARFFPQLDADGWARVVLAAAVRSYVQIVDPHGAWAPFDEEASVYEVDLESHPPGRLWDKGSRTAIGVRIESQPVAPLQVDDVLLALAGVPTAGLPPEQIEQLGFASPGALAPVTAVVLRAGESSLRTLNITAAPDVSPLAPLAADDLPVDRIPYAAGDALIVRIADVRDDLGDELSRAFVHERESDTRPILGVVLDLRGNGGGSTEGAIAALGLFLPGAPLFPMKRRDGTIETDRAPEPPAAERWTGAVATLVDSETASAAEMIAGALAVYRRGASVGTPTYGKGCAQEYVDDDAHTGVLRLTTLLYALPDGSPVQRVGLAPTILLPLSPSASATAGTEREATLAHAPPSWRGPDVRELAAPAHPGDTPKPSGVEPAAAWPPHTGSVGPCRDAEVCRALRALGGNGGKRISSAKPPPPPRN